METVISFSAENLAAEAMFENQSSDFYFQNDGHPKPKEDDTDDDENDDSDDDNPPVDPDTNQAPVVIQPTPKPKDK